MRCLYCGKELALLKRWTGGGEFCSDAHRQQYQEEYNQLALTRLLQAKPQQAEPVREPVQKEPAAKEAVAREAPRNGQTREAATVTRSSPKRQEIAAPAVAIAAEPEPVREPIPQPVARIPEPEPEPEIEMEPEPEEIEDPAPAEMSSFLLEIPVPVLAEVMVMSRPDIEFENGSAPELPRRMQLEEWASQLVAAGPVETAQFGTFVDCAPRAGAERRLEVREFTRTTPIVQVDLSFAGDAFIAPVTENTMDISITPHPPQGDPELWSETWRQFSFEQSLGALARVTFRTTGLEDNEDAADPMAEGGEVEPLPQAAHSAAAHAGAVEEPVQELVQEIAPEAPVVEQAIEPEPEPVIEEEIAAAPQETAPTMSTTPMPLTLHGLAAGRGKPVQVFTAVASTVDVHIPRSNALPLRPVMTLGPAPTVAKAPEEAPKKAPEKTVVVKVDPKKGQPGKSDPRAANGKGKKDAQAEKPAQIEKAIDKARKEAEAKPAPVVKEAAAKEAVKEDAKPVKPETSIWKDPTEKAAAAKAEEPAEKPAKRRESTLPAPMSAPYTPPDLGLPNLNIEASGGFWGRLPMTGKLMLLVTLIGLAIGVTYIIKSAGGTVAAGPQVVATPLPDDGAWILDWGSEPGVRRTHDLYIRKSSLTLSDYRIEFTEQMEGKALGWVYRAQDSKNFYVARVEAAKAGVEPAMSVVHWAVVDGQEQTHIQTPLNVKPAVHLDTIFKIRFDALGDHFTTFVQDQKVDEWTDDRFKVGGVGLYNEHGAKPVSLNVALLTVKK